MLVGVRRVLQSSIIISIDHFAKLKQFRIGLKILDVILNRAKMCSLNSNMCVRWSRIYSRIFVYCIFVCDYKLFLQFSSWILAILAIAPERNSEQSRSNIWINFFCIISRNSKLSLRGQPILARSKISTNSRFFLYQFYCVELISILEIYYIIFELHICVCANY